MADISFDRACQKALDYIRGGATAYQKFTCSKCGARLTMEEPNKFYETGTCDQCGHLTDIRKQGCGFLLHFGEGRR
jgi:DNA-directed RNA polymerase subunit RPC12/RpoP